MPHISISQNIAKLILWLNGNSEEVVPLDRGRPVRMQAAGLRFASGATSTPSTTARYKCTCRAGRGMVKASAGWRGAVFKGIEG